MQRTLNMACLTGLLLGLLLVSCTTEQPLGMRVARDAASDASDDAGTDACAPSCGGRECGSDGCGGLCGTCGPSATCNAESARCQSACVPTCDGEQTCGDDGCGGMCGSVCADDRVCLFCPNGNACVVETYDCRCPASFTVTYELDASSFDWVDLVSIELILSHFSEDGSRQMDQRALLTEGDGMDHFNYEVAACEADLEVLRIYTMRDGIDCEFTDRVNRANIVIPPSALGGASCTAPAL